MDSLLKISIITATYNSYPNILSMLRNIQSQSYPNIELIIIDGGSNDGTLEEIKKCNFVANYISEPDQGIYDALNKGLKLASGQIIGFLHSDDIFADNNIVSKIVNQYKNKKIDGVYGDLQYVNKKNTNTIIRNWKSCNFQPSLLKKGWMPAHPTLFLKKEVYIKHGNFDLTYKISADYDFMLRVFKDNNLNFIYLPKVITKMRLGGESNRNLKNIIIKTKEDYRAMTSNKIGNWRTLFLKNYTKFKQFY
jgi:glycosyltransferase involved in cell wall biosynthesis